MARFVIAAISGVAIGILSGIFGIGGGGMMVALFRLGFGLPALAATGTSLFTMIFTSISGSVMHIKNRMCIVPLGLVAGICGAVGAPIGVRLASMSPTWLVMTATALVVAYSAITMIRKGLAVPKQLPQIKVNSHTSQEPSAATEAAPSAPNATLVSAAADAATNATPAPTDTGATSHAAVAPTLPAAPTLTRKQYVIGAFAGIVAGVAGGYVGLGGGFLMIPIFLSGVKISMKHASATSLLAVAILAASGAFFQGSLGNVDVVVGLATAAGSIPAALFGANLLQRLPERQLRLGFGVVLLLVSVVLAINEFVA